ncbi:MAG: hypothetical protein QNL61_02525 [Crocinitomicaceae bacterium]
MEPESNNAVIRAASAFFIIGFILLLIYLGSDILFPLIMALLFAILLRLISKFFNEKLKLPNIIAIGLTVLLALFVMSGVVLFMSQQIAEFMPINVIADLTPFPFFTAIFEMATEKDPNFEAPIIISQSVRSLVALGWISSFIVLGYFVVKRRDL